MTLPPRIPKQSKKTGRWKSPAHCNFVRSHNCCVADCTLRPIEVAHLRKGTDAGMGRKASDWFTLSLCQHHHSEQHLIGEVSFAEQHNLVLHELASAFAKASPKAREIVAAQKAAA